jgi:hypothetical protein
MLQEKSSEQQGSIELRCASVHVLTEEMSGKAHSFEVA